MQREKAELKLSRGAVAMSFERDRATGRPVPNFDTKGSNVRSSHGKTSMRYDLPLYHRLRSMRESLMHALTGALYTALQIAEDVYAKREEGEPQSASKSVR